LLRGKTAVVVDAFPGIGRAPASAGPRRLGPLRARPALGVSVAKQQSHYCDTEQNKTDRAHGSSPSASFRSDLRCKNGIPSDMRIWQTIKRSPWPLRIIYFVVAVYLAFVLIAALVWFEFGRDAEHQVVDLGWDLTTMVGIVVFPVLLIGLIAAPTALVNWTDWKRRSDVFSD
jgi:hypothetical protein